jgi:UDP-N-acetylglucosamine diphosphorylase / glucose-1-phosphate thymidylyltransferase / UDP-N-acetylgalactosamine diphosphorylase / glucosamine-1-phosphate N-acetyltransferase / galactosamine-1-phosphate N-acetyltransferase
VNQAYKVQGAAIEGDVYIGKGVVIEPDTFIQGPAIIGDHCQIRQGAYIRGNLILGNGCVVGHATEVKNAIFFNKAQAPHFAYVGDSILGNHVNLGAGTRVANLPLFSAKDPATSKRPSIRLKIDDQEIDTGLSKFGAILGDHSQTGCNVVISPGCIIGRGCRIYALVSLRKGYYPPNSIVKLRQDTEAVARE